MGTDHTVAYSKPFAPRGHNCSSQKGDKLRVNFTLKEFDIATFKWERGDMSLLLDMYTDEKAVLLDNVEKKFCVFRTEEVTAQQLIAEKNTTKYHLNASQLDFKRAKTLLNHDKTVIIGNDALERP
ncbi:hypothetical protein niasHS_011207 [Heterodera schachtii]|uniref:Uncharacterized protein n=1 Tax=Heterodera schachtii TaxID=97005 RepID=A0ABD2IZW3_HETSC